MGPASAFHGNRMTLRLALILGIALAAFGLGGCSALDRLNSTR